MFTFINYLRLKYLDYKINRVAKKMDRFYFGPKDDELGWLTDPEFIFLDNKLDLLLGKIKSIQNN